MAKDLSSLDKIATGEISISAATELLRQNLDQLSEKKAKKVYTVLRAWVWKALNERRRDNELRQWHSLISHASACMEDEFVHHAVRIQVLHELVYESISAKQVYSHDDLVGRSHVKEILIYIYEGPDHSIERRKLVERLGLKDANLSRVLAMMLNAGLVERSARGKHAIFSLTSSGRHRAKAFAGHGIVRGELHRPDAAVGFRSGTVVKDQRHHHVRLSITSIATESVGRPGEILKSGFQAREKPERRYEMLTRYSKETIHD